EMSDDRWEMRDFEWKIIRVSEHSSIQRPSSLISHLSSFLISIRLQEISPYGYAHSRPTPQACPHKESSLLHLLLRGRGRLHGRRPLLRPCYVRLQGLYCRGRQVCLIHRASA